jgi:Protein of unknown function (DUF3105)
MAQRKSPQTGKSATNKATSGGPAGKASGSSAGKGPSRPGGSGGANRPTKITTRPPVKPPKKGKSIVNQRQTPWGLIISAIVVVAFAAAVVIVVIATHKSSSSTTAKSSTTGGQTVDANDPYRQPELPAAKKITGLTYKVEGQHTHVTGVIKYDSSPPVGGNHSQIWANCNGVVYTHQLANENAVHMLEHGAVWITYNPVTLPKSQLPALEAYVKGQARVAMTPYAGLKTPISLQAWGYQLFVNSASDPRIAQFISTLEFNPKTTPENALCTDTYWTATAAKDSTPGHPVED